MLGLTLDAEGRVQSVNQNFLDDMHYKSQDLIGRSVEDLVPAYLRSNEFQIRFKTALTRGEHFSGAVRLTRATARRPGCARSSSRYATPRGEFVISRCTPMI